MNWQELIDLESNKDYFVKLSSFVNDERAKYNVYPSSSNVFNALTLCPLDKITLYFWQFYYTNLEKNIIFFLSNENPSFL